MHHEILLIGNLGRDPELRYTQSGQAVATLSVATNRTYTSNDETVKETCWFRVSVWGKQAEACNQYLTKGRAVFIRGRLNPDKETGGPRVFQRNDGSYGAAFEVTAEAVRFLGGRGESEGSDQSAGSPAEDEPLF